MDKTVSSAKRQRTNKKLQILFSGITDEMIKQKAYEIWQQTGNTDQVANWLAAEQFLKAGCANI